MRRGEEEGGGWQKEGRKKKEKREKTWGGINFRKLNTNYTILHSGVIYAESGFSSMEFEAG